MNLKSFFNAVESIEFAINFSVLSGFRAVQSALADNEVLIAFIAYLNKYSGQQNKVLERISSLARKNIDPNYQHPDDISLAAYLFVLSKVNYALAYTAANELVKTKNLWWSKKLADAVVESMRTKQDIVTIRSGSALRLISNSMGAAVFLNTDVPPAPVEFKIIEGKAS